MEWLLKAILLVKEVKFVRSTSGDIHIIYILYVVEEMCRTGNLAIFHRLIKKPLFIKGFVKLANSQPV
jgi:hypothetical protein